MHTQENTQKKKQAASYQEWLDTIKVTKEIDWIDLNIPYLP